MKAEGEIKFEGKIRIRFRCVKYDGVIQSINEDVLNTPRHWAWLGAGVVVTRQSQCLDSAGTGAPIGVSLIYFGPATSRHKS